MTTQLKGYGRLFSQQRWIDEVEFEVDVPSDANAEGYLWSLDANLPVAPAALDLDTREDSPRLRVELMGRDFDRGWHKYKYRLRCLLWQPTTEADAAPAFAVSRRSAPIPVLGN